MKTIPLVDIWRITALLPTMSSWVDDSDFDQISRLAAAYGDRLFTEILPKYGKNVERFWETGVWISPMALGETRVTDAPPILERAFAFVLTPITVDGGAPAVPTKDHAEATRSLRQLLLFAYKIECDPTEEQKSATWAQFLKTDSETGDVPVWEGAIRRDILTRARRLIRQILGRFDAAEVVGFHGSGSSACGIKPARRYGSERVIHELNSVFPYDQHFCVNWNHCMDLASRSVPFKGTRGYHFEEYLEDRAEFTTVDDLLYLPEQSVGYKWVHSTEFASLQELTSKVVFVPKDSRGPRLISEEPRELMYIQQGIRILMTERIARSPWARELALDDQFRQRSLARQSSIDRSMATIDLQEASDRVGLELVRALFPSDWYQAMLACRSLKTLYTPSSGMCSEVCEFR